MTKIFYIATNASKTLSNQQLLQYVAAISSYINCTALVRNANHDIPSYTKSKLLYFAKA
jgi:hypothetical protein